MKTNRHLLPLLFKNPPLTWQYSSNQNSTFSITTLGSLRIWFHNILFILAIKYHTNTINNSSSSSSQITSTSWKQSWKESVPNSCILHPNLLSYHTSLAKLQWQNIWALSSSSSLHTPHTLSTSTPLLNKLELVGKISLKSHH